MSGIELLIILGLGVLVLGLASYLLWWRPLSLQVAEQDARVSRELGAYDDRRASLRAAMRGPSRTFTAPSYGARRGPERPSPQSEIPSGRSAWDDSPMNPASPSGMMLSPLSPLSPSYAGSDHSASSCSPSSSSYDSSSSSSSCDSGSSSSSGAD